MRKCAKFDFIINSEEFIHFSRPIGDIAKIMSKLSKVQPSTMLERMQASTNIDPSKYDLTDKERFANSIIEFTFFSKKVLPQLKQLKKSVKDMKTVKNSSIANYKVFMNLIDKYEELNLASYVDGNPDHMILGDVKNAEMKN